MHSQYSEFQEELDRLWSKYTRWDVVADNHSWNEDVCKKAMDLAEMFYAQYQALLVKARAAQAKRVVMVSTPAAVKYDQEWLDEQQEEYKKTIAGFEAGTGRM